MIVDRKWVIKDYEIQEKLKDKKIAIYGIGEDAGWFYDKYESKIKINNFIVTKLDLTTNYRGKPVYEVKDFVESNKDKTIVICSSRYALEMANILNDLGLKCGKNYWFWDKDYTVIVRRFIEHENIRKCSYNGENIILIPIERCHDGSAILYKYCIEYFCLKNDAHPVGYSRQLGNPFETVIFPSTQDVYASIGVKEIVYESVDDDIEVEFKKIVSNIETMDDWQNINIAGMECGKSFLRDYLRLSKLDFHPRGEAIDNCLRYAIKTVLFWKKYLKKNVVSTVLLWDGVHNESYLRDISLELGLDTYILHPLDIAKPFKNYTIASNYPYLKDFFYQLNEKEKKIGLEWAKKIIKNTYGENKNAFVPYRGGYQNLFASTEVLPSNVYKDESLIKIIICPHIFDEDQWLNGEQICGNNYISWLEFLGNVSNVTSYSWYLKIHPDETERGILYLKEYLKRYSNINLIEAQVSPKELQKAGFRYAVTIAGSIGHEYPLLGIDVINSGSNPHMAFDFNINPKSKAELLDVLLHLQSYSKLENANQIYDFYAVYYFYYQDNQFSEEFQDIFDKLDFLNLDIEHTIYSVYMDKYTDCYTDMEIKEKIEKLLKKVKLWKPGIFYRKSETKLKKLLQKSNL